MIDVILSEGDRSRAEAAAKAVNDHKEAIGKPHRSWKGSNADPLTIRRDSFLAELAVARYLGLNPPTWEVFDGGDGKIDLTIPCPTSYGTTIQVKYRGDRNRDLATEGLDFWDELRADIYVLAWPCSLGMTLVGWCLRSEWWERIFDHPPVRMLGRKFEMKWQELAPMRLLLEEVLRARDQAALDCAAREDEERQGHGGGETVGAVPGAGGSVRGTAEGGGAGPGARRRRSRQAEGSAPEHRQLLDAA